MKVKMDKIHRLLEMLKTGENFALARFNDGEMKGVEHVGAKVARGDQTVNKELSEKLKQALRHKQHNYWIGLPCPVCWPGHRKVAETFIDADYPFLTCAVVTTNRNWKLFIREFGQSVGNRPVAWVSGDSQNLEGLKKHGIELNVVQQLGVPVKNAFSKYPDIKAKVSAFQPDSVVVISCGPMSRVLACDWWKERQDCTFLDVGSAFDPFTRNVWHKCHKGVLKRCEGCN